MSRHPNLNNKSLSLSSSSVWSSPNIGQMTEMSQDWYRKMMNDSADLIRVSLESQYKDMELADFISQSQPPPQANYAASSQQSIDSFPFNSLPNQVLPDIPDLPLFCGGGALFTPEPSRQPSKDTSAAPSNRGSVQPRPPQNIFNDFNHQAQRGRRYHNTNLLAQYCQQVLAITAHPTLSQIDGIVDKLKDPDSNHVTCKKLRSSVREWFRKRREYMATKVYKSCQRLLPAEAPENKEEIDQFIKKIHKNSALMGIIMLESHLPMASEKEKIAFVKEKIVDFYMKYPARRKRNLHAFKVNLFDEFADEDQIVNLSQDDVNSLVSSKKKSI